HATGSLGDQAFGFGSIWTTVAGAGAFSKGTLQRIDQATGSVTRSVKVGADPVVAVGDGAVWVYNEGDGTVVRVDPRTMDITPVTSFQNFEYSLPLVAYGSVWVTAFDQNVVYRVNETS